ATMSTGELISIPRMDLKRVDMILSGSILLEECAAVIGATKIVATEFSLRDGIMYEQSLGLSTATGASLLAHLDDIVAWAARFGVNEKESRKHLRNAALVFRSSKKMHRLSRHWEPYLLAAAVLRRTGELISSVDFGAHSAYIVEHAKFPFLEDWETRLIAHICRSSDPTGAKKFDRKQLRRLELPMECAPITGLLILCETLHLGGAPIGNFRVRGRGKKWYLHHPRLTAGGVEAVKLQQYSKLFKDAFEKKIEIG
ncbi:MAG TPA: hypothetical protein PLH57_03445, partial [Oligoflexia bacterium]|nr:hypothetical protein [Oligoflexia bacterium]